MIFDGGSVLSLRKHSPSHACRRASPLSEGAEVPPYCTINYDLHQQGGDIPTLLVLFTFRLFTFEAINGIIYGRI